MLINGLWISMLSTWTFWPPALHQGSVNLRVEWMCSFHSRFLFPLSLALSRDGSGDAWIQELSDSPNKAYRM
jgi:hypothetical protein